MFQVIINWGTWFIRLRHEMNKAITIDGDLELEDAEIDTFNRFRLGVTWRF